MYTSLGGGVHNFISGSEYFAHKLPTEVPRYIAGEVWGNFVTEAVLQASYDCSTPVSWALLRGWYMPVAVPYNIWGMDGYGRLGRWCRVLVTVTFGGQKPYERSLCAEKDPQCRNQRPSKTQQ